MSREFWAALHFALECARDTNGPFNWTEDQVEKQSKYSWEDVAFVMFPVLKRFDLVVTSCSFRTPEGEQALALLRRGRRPTLDFDVKITLDVCKDAEERAQSYDLEYYGEDGFSTDPDGYTAFFTLMLKLDLSSNYTAAEWHLWNQVYQILQGGQPSCYDILCPFIESFEDKDMVIAFLKPRLERGQHAFLEWMYYAENVCPVL
jgi:hypothetical protein